MTNPLGSASCDCAAAPQPARLVLDPHRHPGAAKAPVQSPQMTRFKFWPYLTAIPALFDGLPDQRVRHWILARRSAFEYIGGFPSRWIIDNLKAGVDKPDREESQLNPSFREFAQHYGVAVLPARSGRGTRSDRPQRLWNCLV